MMLREAIEQYILWRQAHGAKFTTGANLLRRFLDHADGDAACDAVTTAQVLAFLAGKGPLTRHRENKYYALAGFWRHAISRGHATRSPLPGQRTEIARPGAALYLLARRAAAALRSRDRGDQPARRGSAGRGDVPDPASPACTEPGCASARRRASRWRMSIWRNAVLTIRATKFYKSRLVPVGPQLAAVLDGLRVPAPARRACARRDAFLLANRDGTRLASSTVQAAFDTLAAHRRGPPHGRRATDPAPARSPAQLRGPSA